MLCHARFASAPDIQLPVGLHLERPGGPSGNAAWSSGRGGVHVLNLEAAPVQAPVPLGPLNPLGTLGSRRTLDALGPSRALGAL